MRRLALPAGVDPGIEVWLLDLDPAQPIDVAAWSDLDEDERARALALRRAGDRLRYGATRSALRRLLARRLGRGAAELRFAAGPHGKPALVGAPEVAFNVSHSGAHALIALGGAGALGVDIEATGAGLPERGVLERVLTSAERAWVGTEPDAFYTLWTAKEALLKAHGTGIRIAPDRLGLERDAQGALCLLHAPAEIAAAAPAIWKLSAPPGYAAALATMAR